MFDVLDAVILAAGLGGAAIVRDLFRVLILGLVVRGVRGRDDETTTPTERPRSAADNRVRATVRRTRGGADE